MANDHQENRTNLIINYLPQTLTDAEFKNLFMSIGPLKSCKIVRHKATGYSYGFGFADYVNPKDATRAIEALNGMQLQNKKIKVAFARPSGEAIKNANLYIRGLPKTMTQAELESIFSKCGNIIQARILKDEATDMCKGVGFVLYETREQAEKAVDELSGTLIPGATEPVSIKFAEDNAKKVRPPPTPLANFTTLRAAGLAGGPMRQSGVQNRYRFNPMTGNYQYSATGSSTTGENGGHILFVYNIGTDADEKSIWQLFSQYGTVTKVNIIRDPTTGQSKGFGFVTMMTYEEAVWAIESLNGFRYAGRPLQVSFKSQKWDLHH